MYQHNEDTDTLYPHRRMSMRPPPHRPFFKGENVPTARAVQQKL